MLSCNGNNYSSSSTQRSFPKSIVMQRCTISCPRWSHVSHPLFELCSRGLFPRWEGALGCSGSSAWINAICHVSFAPWLRISFSPCLYKPEMPHCFTSPRITTTVWNQVFGCLNNTVRSPLSCSQCTFNKRYIFCYCPIRQSVSGVLVVRHQGSSCLACGWWRVTRPLWFDPIGSS